MAYYATNYFESANYNFYSGTKLTNVYAYVNLYYCCI